MKHLTNIISCFVALVSVFSPFVASAEVEQQIQTAPTNIFAGTLVKTTTDTAVYYIGLDEKRHAFPNANIYFSWYKDFSDVQVITESKLAKYPLGKNVLYRPGSRLVKIAEVPEVYAVEPGGNLRNLPSEAVAVALYGPNWSKKVDDLDISFFFDYNIAGVAEVVDDRAIYPRGTVVNFDSANYLVDRRSDGIFLLRKITDAAWDANGFDRLERQLMADNSLREFFEFGLPVVVAEAAFACPACDAVFSQRHSTAQVETKTSASGKYSVHVPAGWQARFRPSSDPESKMVLFASPTDAFSAVSLVNVEEYPLGEGETLETYIAMRLAEVQTAGEFYYQGPSLFLNTGYEVVFSPSLMEDPSAETPLDWWRFFQSGDTAYVLRYTTTLGGVGADIDVMELMLRTFAADQRIPE